MSARTTPDKDTPMPLPYMEGPFCGACGEELYMDDDGTWACDVCNLSYGDTADDSDPKPATFQDPEGAACGQHDPACRLHDEAGYLVVHAACTLPAGHNSRHFCPCHHAWAGKSTAEAVQAAGLVCGYKPDDDEED